MKHIHPDRTRQCAKWRSPPLASCAARQAINQGRRYEEAGGHGRPDYLRAAACYRLAIRQGDPMGLLFLGQLYQFGRGLPADTRRAALLFIRAYRRGVCAAAIHLANIYDHGQQKTALERRRALRWYRIAAGMGRHGELLARARIKALS